MKWLGTILIIAGCGYAGIAAGIAYKREEAALEQLCEHLQYMHIIFCSCVSICSI